MKLVSLCVVSLLVAIPGAVCAFRIHGDNAELEGRILSGRSRPAGMSGMTAQNQRSHREDRAEEEMLKLRIASLRQEFETLERSARDRAEKRGGLSGSALKGGDPETELTSLENLRDVGKGTPAAAVQTFFWALLKGQNQIFENAFYLNDDVRESADEFIATLPEAERTKFPTAESVEALAIARSALNVSGIQITNTEKTSDETATVTVRGLTPKDEKLPMRLTPAGWQLVVGEKQMDWALQQLRSGK